MGPTMVTPLDGCAWQVVLLESTHRPHPAPDPSGPVWLCMTMCGPVWHCAAHRRCLDGTFEIVDTHNTDWATKTIQSWACMQSEIFLSKWQKWLVHGVSFDVLTMLAGIHLQPVFCGTCRTVTWACPNTATACFCFCPSNQTLARVRTKGGGGGSWVDESVCTSARHIESLP